MDLIEIIGAVIGLLYLYLEYKANRWLWPVGVIMPLVYVYIFFHAKFYADMGIHIYYFFASVYGWIRWSRRSSAESGTSETGIRHTPFRMVAPLVGVVAVVFGIIAYILVNYTDSPVAYGDSFTTALCVVAMWMLAHKYIEQWWLWFAVNVVSCGLYVWKGLDYTAGLFFVYSVVSVLGYFKWKRLMQS